MSVYIWCLPLGEAFKLSLKDCRDSRAETVCFSLYSHCSNGNATEYSRQKRNHSEIREDLAILPINIEYNNNNNNNNNFTTV